MSAYSSVPFMARGPGGNDNTSSNGVRPVARCTVVLYAYARASAYSCQCLALSATNAREPARIVRLNLSTRPVRLRVIRGSVQIGDAKMAADGLKDLAGELTAVIRDYSRWRSIRENLKRTESAKQP